MPLSIPTPLGDISAAVWTYLPNRRLTNLADVRAALIDNLDVLLSSRESEAAALARATAILAAIGAIPTTPELEANALARYTALVAEEIETEWQTDPIVENVASAALTTLTAGSITPTYPTGSTERRVILLAMIKAASQAGNTHHIGVKVQYRTGGAGPYSDLKDYTANPPLTLPTVDGATDMLTLPIDVTAIVSSGVQVEFRFAVDSDNAGSINYTTSFILALVYRMA